RPEATGIAGACTAGEAGPAAEHLAEDVLDVGLGAAGGEPYPLPTSAEVGEDVLEAAASGGEASAAVGHGPDRVVLLALLRIGQDGIRLTDLLEALLGLGVPD